MRALGCRVGRTGLGPGMEVSLAFLLMPLAFFRFNRIHSAAPRFTI